MRINNVKIFSWYEPTQLQQDIQQWLQAQAHQLEIQYITQSSYPADSLEQHDEQTIISIWYYKEETS